MAADSGRVRSSVGTNHESMRRRNLSGMLQIIHNEGEVSRAGLTTRMRLAASTIGDLLCELEALGFIALEDPTDHTTAGRPSPVARARSGRVRVLAADVGGDHIGAGVFGLGGVMLARAQAHTPSSHEPEEVAEATAVLLRELAADLPADPLVLGIGVGVAGIVGQDEVVRMAPHLGWRDVAFLELLRARLPSPLLIRAGNDADLGALAEHRRGAGVGMSNMLYIGCDDFGVGGGIIVDGKPYRGDGGFAGEIGHMLIDPRGRACNCGSSGCWETEISVARVAQTLGMPGAGLHEVATALAGISQPSAELVAVGEYLGLGIGSLVNILNVGLVVLGGNLRDLYPVVKDTTDAALAKAALPAPLAQITVMPSQMGADAVLVGASEMIVNTLFEDPTRSLTDIPMGSITTAQGLPLEVTSH